MKLLQFLNKENTQDRKSPNTMQNFIFVKQFKAKTRLRICKRNGKIIHWKCVYFTFFLKTWRNSSAELASIMQIKVKKKYLAKIIYFLVALSVVFFSIQSTGLSLCVIAN